MTALAARWFGPVPARRLVIVRMLTFGYALGWLVVRSRYLYDVSRLPARRWDPVGVLDALAAPPADGLVLVIWLVSVAACAAVVVGRATQVAAPAGAAGLLLLVTYTSSFGQVFHTEHLLALHLVVLAVAAVVEPVRGEFVRGWPLELMMCVVVVVYVVAGVAKLRWSGADWVTGDVLRNWIAVDNLRKELFGDIYSPLGGWLATVPWVWGPIAVATLAVELGSPVALRRGRVRLLWIAVAWGFHVGVFVLMAISFPYQLFGVAYLAFLPVERIGAVWPRRRGGAVARQAAAH